MPIVQLNTSPPPEAEDLIVAYTGNDDIANGQNAGEMMLDAREYAREKDFDLNSPEGNLIVIGFPPGYAGA